MSESLGFFPGHTQINWVAVSAGLSGSAYLGVGPVSCHSELHLVRQHVIASSGAPAAVSLRFTLLSAYEGQRSESLHSNRGCLLQKTRVLIELRRTSVRSSEGIVSGC